MRRVFIAITAATLCACNAPADSGFTPSSNVSGLAPQGASRYIKHVVIVIQENRSFDNFFATYPGADGTTVGKTPHGTVKLVKKPLYQHLEPYNTRAAFLTDYDNGKMDGFGSVPVSGYSSAFVYQYVDPKQIAPYWEMARQYVLADHVFQTQGSGSFTAHQDLIRGDTAISPDKALVDNPDSLVWGCPAPPHTRTPVLKLSGAYVARALFPCLSYATLRDTLDAKRVSWRYYAPAIETGGNSAQDLWSAFAAIKAVYRGPEWQTNVSSPETNVFGDISDGSLAGVSWIVPDFDNSDHPGAPDNDTGPSWVASIVNAIGKSRYWNSTAIVVVWDDWGGFYDHVPPPSLPNTVSNLGGPGFRVPMIVISPYAKRGYISHNVYGFGSIVRFVETVFALHALNTTDATSAGFVKDFFSFGKPRAFTPIKATYSRSFFLHQRPSNKPVDTD